MTQFKYTLISPEVKYPFKGIRERRAGLKDCWDLQRASH